MDVLKEKLREFYQKQYAESLLVRKTASNYLLVEKRDGKKSILARFNIAGLGEGVALVLAHDARGKASMLKADHEMAILEGSVLSPAKDVLPTDAEGMEVPLKDCQPVAKPNPLGDLFDMGRTATDAKPLE